VRQTASDPTVGVQVFVGHVLASRNSAGSDAQPDDAGPVWPPPPTPCWSIMEISGDFLSSGDEQFVNYLPNFFKLLVLL
jgi:hypothetical protein